MMTMMLPMNSSKLLRHLFIATAITVNFSLVYASSSLSIPHHPDGDELAGRRALKSFKEKASGTNITFDCSPSGPCVPCAYYEKKDENYRCSETGYRIPMKCVKIGAGADEGNDKKKQKERSILEKTYQKLKTHVFLHDAEEIATSIRHRNLLEDSSKTEGGSETYITYRSCIPAMNQEKLSVLGFEGIVLLLLICSSFVIFRKKGTSVLPGAVRVPTNSRF